MLDRSGESDSTSQDVSELAMACGQHADHRLQYF